MPANDYDYDSGLLLKGTKRGMKLRQTFRLFYFYKFNFAGPCFQKLLDVDPNLILSAIRNPQISFFSSLLAKRVQDVDVVFAISATATDAQLTFRVMKDVIKTIFEKHGVDSMRVAIIVFGDAVSVRLSFDEEVTELDELKERIDNLPRNTGTPDLNAALVEGNRLLAGARLNAKKVLVIISDDTSDSSPWEIRANARELEQEEIEVVPVGMGNEVDLKQLEHTTPHKDNLITADTEDDTDDLADEILQKILRSECHFS